MSFITSLKFKLHSLSIDKVDAILVSNWISLVALPFFTESTDFSGVVYATDPTIQLGRYRLELFCLPWVLPSYSFLAWDASGHFWIKTKLFQFCRYINNSYKERIFITFWSRYQVSCSSTCNGQCFPRFLCQRKPVHKERHTIKHLLILRTVINVPQWYSSFFCRLVMEELLDFFDRVDRDELDESWKIPELFM